MQSFEKLSISLPVEMAQMIRDKVNAGTYGSNSEVIREAMRGWLDREKRLNALDAAMARGMSDIDAGRSTDVETARRKLHARYKKNGPA